MTSFLKLHFCRRHGVFTSHLMSELIQLRSENTPIQPELIPQELLLIFSSHLHYSMILRHPTRNGSPLCSKSWWISIFQTDSQELNRWHSSAYSIRVYLNCVARERFRLPHDGEGEKWLSLGIKQRRTCWTSMQLHPDFNSVSWILRKWWRKGRGRSASVGYKYSMIHFNPSMS